MAADSDKWLIVAVATSEVEGALIVAALESENIEAYLEGGMTASFRAEAPGQARVLVREEDMARATEVVAQFWPQPSASAPACTLKRLCWAVAIALLAVVLLLILILIPAIA